MKSFGSKRKARVIKVEDPDEQENVPEAPAKEAESNDSQAPLFAKVTRKPFRQSGLRKSINVEEAADDDKPTTVPAAKVDTGDKEDDGNVVVRSSISRAGSTKKKRKPASRLSFGVRAEDDEEASVADAGGPDVYMQKKKNRGSGLKKSISLKDLTMRSRVEEDDRPRYSKEYLEELQSSTPNTPRPASQTDTAPEAEDEMNLDASELEGAMIVDDPSSVPAQPVSTTAPRILTTSEIQEKKERRARLAHETDFISLSDDEDSSKKKDDGRLVRDDENMYEGFEDFVEDDDVALGRKAEREARRRKREEMASLIREAEGNSEDESDESDAERRVAFEAAQSRAGMDGLKRPSRNPAEPAPKPKITPLPSMVECLRTLQETLAAKKGELEGKSRKVAELRSEREEIKSREAEVQRLVDEAGEKYKAVVAGAGSSAGALEGGESPAQMLGEAGEFAAERGLESFGTPTVKGDVDEDVAV